jgi:hypothetical protein
LKLAKLPWTHKSLVEPENAKIKRQKINDFMVADAVAIEPVSRSDFPANREKNSENLRFAPKWRFSAPTQPVISIVYSNIPCEN